MKVLVAYATRHGGTRGIAERIAATLGRPGLEVSLGAIVGTTSVEGYDALVIGSAAYMHHWLPEATEFVLANEALLADKPVWLFSSGPTGPDKVDKKGRDVIEASIPKEFATFEPAIHPRDARVFFGAWDPLAEPAVRGEGFLRGFLRVFPGLKGEMPSGDFRDWQAIEAWAEAIAKELLGTEAMTPA
jgi:menaquinone-dependent protoporphyrinogen oxidase